MNEITQLESWALIALIHGDLQRYAEYMNQRNALRERHPFQCLQCGEHLHHLAGTGEDAWEEHTKVCGDGYE